jgi:electron transfer flavoprotein alpha/beta subunit
MNIIVCIKQVHDPDTPATAYGIDASTKQIHLSDDVPLVINPYDENAVEAALQLKDQTGGKVTVLSLATRPADRVVRDLKQTLAMGADEAILLDDPAFEGGDSHSTAYALACAIKKIGEFDLVLCGLQAADWDAGQVGLGIAENLDLPSVTYITKVKPGEGHVRAMRMIDNGHEILELPTPCVLSIANDKDLAPRIARLAGIMKAKKRELPVWAAADMDADPSQIGAAGAKTTLHDLALPQITGACEFIEAETPAEAAIALVDRLHAEKII